jgi:hypothetical protein
MTLWIAQARAALLGVVVGAVLCGALLLSRRSVSPPPVVVQLGNTKPKPEVDLSPKATPRSVVVARVSPGKPTPSPVTPPKEVATPGQGPATTLDVPVQSGSDRFTLHAALYPLVLGERRLGFRSVLWGEDASGAPIRIGDAVQVDAPNTEVSLLPSPPPPPWRVGPLLYFEGTHARWGLVASYQRVGTRWGVLGVAMPDRAAIGLTVSF